MKSMPNQSQFSAILDPLNDVAKKVIKVAADVNMGDVFVSQRYPHSYGLFYQVQDDIKA